MPDQTTVIINIQVNNHINWFLSIVSINKVQTEQSAHDALDGGGKEKINKEIQSESVCLTKALKAVKRFPLLFWPKRKYVIVIYIQI